MPETQQHDPNVGAGFFKLALICLAVMAIGVGLMQALLWLTGG